MHNITTVLNDNKYNINSSMLLDPWPSFIYDTNHPFGVTPGLPAPLSKWSTTDSELVYNKHLSTQPADWHYRTKEVTYKHNYSGYRTREWCDIDWKESIVLLGDSCTYGVGLAEDETISYQLEKMLNRPVINLGYPSGSNDIILQHSATIINNFDTPWGVAILWAPGDRFRYYTQTGPVDVGLWSHRGVPENSAIKVDKTISTLWECMNREPANESIRTYYDGQIGKSLWKSTRYCSFSFFSGTAHYARTDGCLRADQQARDLMHPGRVAALDAATLIAVHLSNQLDN